MKGCFLWWLHHQHIHSLVMETPVKIFPESFMDFLPNNEYFSQTLNQGAEDHNLSHVPHESKDSLWHDLRKRIHDFSKCDLKFSAMNTVYGEGNPKADIFFLGEAPGAQEDEQGRPFVGASGQLLDKMLQSIHIQRQDVFITNVVPWRPPFNRTPTSEEIELCLPFVHEYIALVEPKILVCLGAVAFHSLFPQYPNLSITKAHDLSLVYESPLRDLTIPTYVLYHPSYLLRSSAGKPKTWEQLKKIKKFYTSMVL